MAYARTRLGRLFYEERGERARPGEPAIVLLHALLFDGGMWKGQLEPLSRIGRVVVLDGPGHGKSEPAPRFTLEEHADALYDAFGDLGIRRAVVVGLSWGAMVGMRLALQHPAKVAALALLDSSAEPDTLANRVRHRAFTSIYRRVGLPYPVYLREIAPLMFAPRTAAERPELLEATYRRAAGWDRSSVARAVSAVLVARRDVLPELGRVRVPTLVMCGAEDRATPLARSEAIAKAVPRSRLVTLEGLGHMSVLEDADAVNAHLVPFVRACVESAD